MARFLTVIILFIGSAVFAQEALEDLSYNPHLLKQNSASNRAGGNCDITFLTDTLELPFLDDFSKIRLHRYCNSGTLNFLDTSFATYRINGDIFDSVAVSNDPTFSFYFSSITLSTDTQVNTQLIISEHNKDSAIVNYITNYWPAYNYYFKDGVLLTMDTLSPDSVIVNDQSPILIAYDSSALWTDNHVFINNGYGIDPPTIGVATFDGIDSLGHAYDISQDNSYGIADYLTSKPINLKNKSGVILSFYYQPQGRGNSPDTEDSLIVEFFAPDTNGGKWKHAWSKAGEAQKDFEFVELQITDTSFLKKGFKFRFKNYATLSGSLDHWNIDYVYLNDNRLPGSEITVDLGFKTIDNNFINTYSSMPWSQYIVNPSKYMKADFSFTLTNRSSSDLSGTNTYKVFDLNNGTEIFSSNINQTIFINFPGPSLKDFVFPVNNTPYNFIFPTDTEAEKHFRITMATHSNTIDAQEQNPDNDTVRIEQHFSTYYAYDDGFPERAYSLVGAGAKLAYGFELEEADTLKGLLIHFPEMFNLANNSIRVTVWQNIFDQPGDTLYRGPLFDINYLSVEDPIGFLRFNLDRPVIVPAGKFFVGFEKSFEEKIFVGFDENIESNAKNIYYNTDGSWIETSFSGSLMMRPDFGLVEISQIYPTEIEEPDEPFSFNIYPNPASTELFVDIQGNILTEVTIYNVTGQVVFTRQINESQTIDVSNFDTGIYLVSLRNSILKNTTQKLIISR